MSTMRSQATNEQETVLRTFSAGPFAPAGSTPVLEDLTRRGYIRRKGLGHQGRILYVITQLGLSLLKHCAPQ